MNDDYEGAGPPLYDPRDLGEDDGFHDQVNEEAFYFAVLHDFIDLVRKYGYDKVEKDMGEMLARDRGLQGS